MRTFGNRCDCAVNSARTLFGLTHALRATRDAKKKETKNRTRPQDHAGRGGKTKEKRVRKASSDDHREGTSLLRETRLGVAHLTHNQVPAGTTPFTSLSLSLSVLRSMQNHASTKQSQVSPVKSLPRRAHVLLYTTDETAIIGRP